MDATGHVAKPHSSCICTIVKLDPRGREICSAVYGCVRVRSQSVNRPGNQQLIDQTVKSDMSRLTNQSIYRSDNLATNTFVHPSNNRFISINEPTIEPIHLVYQLLNEQQPTKQPIDKSSNNRSKTNVYLCS